MSSVSLSAVAYQRILQCMLDHSLSGDRRISESELARKLGISRTPIREAICRLESEGLLYQVVGSGTYIARPDRKKLLDAFDVREALECQAVVKATKRMSVRERTELKLQCDNMHAAISALRDSGEKVMTGDALKQFLVSDLKFHLLLLRAANNQFAMKIVTDSRIRDYVFGDSTHERTLRHLAWVWLLHARVSREVQRKNARKAQYWMRRHIRQSRNDALVALQKSRTAGSPRQPAPPELTNLLQSVCEELAVISTPPAESSE
ncbi:GntR family transcriptional regulator [Blastopirellula marina]|uniref:Transcriptional regulator, GntR family protein n=1 Tax=Blastopirellula marina DSM 3645 TaxID=314230 RepID=A3ZY42_9BACT|nr:GntR family transcriptional regulator [Blastopirellula marina]EAQ78504.1 transcriptional regulator, GntR family protein [Blastopirellula marina DSM 3645]